MWVLGEAFERRVTLVAFEELCHGDNAVAVHADIDDAGQTVVYEKPEQPTQPSRTDGKQGK